MTKRMISVRLDAALVDKLDRLANELGMSRSLVLETVVERAVRQSEFGVNEARSLKFKKFGQGPGG